MNSHEGIHPPFLQSDITMQRTELKTGKIRNREKWKLSDLPIPRSDSAGNGGLHGEWVRATSAVTLGMIILVMAEKIRIKMGQ